MNDNMNFTTGSGANDAELEARIVAWVAGEASAFEAAELERLCAARPELAALKREIEAAQRWVRAAVKDERPLRLSAERREKLLAAIGGKTEPAAKRDAPAAFPVPATKRNRWAKQWWLAGAAACGAVLAFVVVRNTPDLGARKLTAAKSEQAVADPRRREASLAEAESWRTARDLRGGVGESAAGLDAPAEVDAIPARARGLLLQSQAGAVPMTESNLQVAGRSGAHAESSAAVQAGTMKVLKDVAVTETPPSGAGEVPFSTAGRVMNPSAPLAQPPSATVLAGVKEGSIAVATAPGPSLSRFEIANTAAFSANEVPPSSAAPATASTAEELVRPMPFTDVRSDGRLYAVAQTMSAGVVMNTVVTPLPDGTVDVSRAGAATAGATERDANRRGEATEQATRLLLAVPPVDEIEAAREPVSTVSLREGDASYQLARAAFARGEMPEAGRIRPEEFYNAFDYGDPSPTSADQVGVTIEQARHPFLPQRNLVRIAVKGAAANHAELQVRFEPQRVGKYRPIGFEQHRAGEEDFRQDAVDTTKRAAGDGAVALYQVEVLPQGEGRLGEVLLRFRDAATGAMVERSWALPAGANAIRFEQASPSLQLAGLAAMTAEKLRGSALASQFKLGDFAGVANALRGHYAHDRAVQEFLEMLAMLRRELRE